MMSKYGVGKRIAAGVMLCVGTLAGMSAAQAAFTNNGFFLNLDQPDITSSFIDVGYSAASGAFSAVGFATLLTPPGSPSGDIVGGGFDLQADIDSGTGNANGGTLKIGGTLPLLGHNSGTLLTGNLSGFGSEAGSDTLEFLFDLTGGDLFADFGGIGGNVGVQLSNTGFVDPPGFTQDFSNAAFTGVADTAVNVPEPGTLMLMLGGALVFVGRRRRSGASEHLG